MSFRDVYTSMLPWWILGTKGNDEGDRVAYSLMSVLDGAMQRLRDGFTQRFPSMASDAALSLTGDERGILRGRTEPREHYAKRLIAWRYPRGHRVRGNDYALLEQVGEYLGGVTAWSADVNSQRCTWLPDGSTAYAIEAWPWGEIDPLRWARFWIGVDASGYHAAASWVGDDGGCLGFADLTPDDFGALRGLLTGARPWKMSGSRGEWLVLSLDGSVVTPNADYAYWSKIVSGVQVPVRDPNQRYVSYSPATNNTYSARVQFARQITWHDGTLRTGDPTNFPTDLQLPGGAILSGDPTRFPTSLPLVDDSEAPL